MSDTLTNTSSNTVHIEDAGPCRKKISIEVPSGSVDEAMNTAYERVAHEAAIPGFRAGRAPRRLVEKRFKTYIHETARSTLVGSAYEDAVQTHDLKVIGQPSEEAFEDIEIEPGSPMRIEVEVEVMPEFELPELEGIKVLKPDAALPQGVIDEEIEKIAINEGDLDEQDESKPGHYLTGKGVMVDQDGTEHHNIDGAVVQIPEEGDEGMILGVIVPDLKTQLGTPKKGDTLTITVKGPENHETEAIRGKDLTTTFDVEHVYEIVPAPMADIVAKYGLATEDQLREMIKAQLDQRAQAQQKSVMRAQVGRHLAEQVDFDLPAGLTANQAARNLQRHAMELMYRGVDQQEIEKQLAELRSSSADRAGEELKQFFLINKAAEQLGVTVEESEVSNVIVQMARQQGKAPEQLQQELMKSGQAQTLVQQVREHKTLDKILESAEIEEVPADEFNERMEALA